jgi:hypothetical protein
MERLSELNNRRTKMPKEKKIKKVVGNDPEHPVMRVKNEMWQALLKLGWLLLPQPVGFNALYSEEPGKEKDQVVRIRYRFLDDQVALEFKRPLTKEEKEKDPRKAAIWEVRKQAEYTKVKLGDKGLVFPD